MQMFKVHNNQHTIPGRVKAFVGLLDYIDSLEDWALISLLPAFFKVQPQDPARTDQNQDREGQEDSSPVRKQVEHKQVEN